MKTVSYVSIGFGWLPILALIAWWAGFMPFPTRPEEIYLHSFDINGAVAPDGKHSVGMGFQMLISAAKAKEGLKSQRFGFGQWIAIQRTNCNAICTKWVRSHSSDWAVLIGY